MTEDEIKDLKDMLRDAAWSIVRDSALYKDQLLSNDECDRKADYLADYLHSTAIVWIVDQECAEIARKEAADSELEAELEAV
jgi:hypothetical protein